jgi:protein-tyrosine phosphatase
MFSSGQKTLIKNLYRPSNGSRQSTRLGNLLLSSCPGKRLRMDGPVKGRGPVCRDLRADMRRIKGEGVGAIVCCLDDEELALLGVPWDYYREVASDIGLDIIRLPMPDGFTPVSLQLFDAQVSLITQRYTLQGINVLVHCRG